MVNNYTSLTTNLLEKECRLMSFMQDYLPAILDILIVLNH